MLGLKRGTVKLSSDHAHWSKAFKRERKRLLKKLSSMVVDIQHIGSTAVPSLPAKLVLDIAIGVRTLKTSKAVIMYLRELGYEYHEKSSLREFFFTKGPQARRTQYIHVMRFNGEKWKNDIVFRNYLRQNDQCRKAYAGLKRRLAKQFSGNRESYTKAKAAFIKETMKKARN